jgi:glyoxylase-like metal-dependent hydrolase (beta-lactamase superfamily II)
MRVAASIHRIGNGTINAYLVEEAGAVTVIDTGIPGLWGAFIAELAAIGRSLEDIRAVVLTHGHADHVGLAERFRRSAGTRAMIHELDAALARGEVPNPTKGLDPFRWRPALAFLAYAARYRYGLGPHVGEVSTFGDGATLDVPGSPRVIHLPGHTPGSAALLHSGGRALFSGDALVTKSVFTGRGGPQIGPFSADRSKALASLARLDDVETDVLLPGHGDPWTGGLAAAVSAARILEARPAT